MFPVRQHVTLSFYRLAGLVCLVLLMLGACGSPQSAAPPGTTPGAAGTLPTSSVEPARSSAESPETTSIPATQISRSQSTEDDELIVVGADIPAGLDPVHELTSSYLRAIGAGEGLLKAAADGTIVPELAASFTNINPTTWQIKLRPNVHFWSGALVDAAAVYASLERSRKLDAQAAPFLADTTIEVVDTATLNFVSKVPNPNLPFNLSHYQLLIHNAASYGDQPNPFNLKVMDLTGMFKATSFTPKQMMLLEVNPDYWGTAPSIKRIRFEEVKDGQARVLAAQSGQAHIVLGIPPESAALLKDDPNVNLVSVPAANTTTVYLNLKSPILSDIKVRQALGWGVNRQELVELAREGFSNPASSWLASNPAFPEAARHGFTKFDPARAASLLDEAGWKLNGNGIREKDGKPLVIRVLTFGAEKAVGEVLQAQWKQIGVQLDVQHADDYGLIQSKRAEGDWDTLIEAWSTFGDPQALLAGQFKPGSKANYGGYDDAVTNQLFEQLAQATSEDERRKLILALNERVGEQAPVIALHPRPQITAVSTKLQGFQPHFRQFENIVSAALQFGQ